MPSDAITLGLGLATILASGVTSSVVTYRLNRNKDQFAFMRTKAEALYLAADEYGRILATYTLPYYRVIKGDLDWNQLLDIHIASGSEKREHGGAELVTMLIEIYFPTVRGVLSDLFKARDEFNTFITGMQSQYVRDEERLAPSQWLPPMNTHANAIDDCTKRLQKAIIEAARTYAGVPQA